MFNCSWRVTWRQQLRRSGSRREITLFLITYHHWCNVLWRQGGKECMPPTSEELREWKIGVGHRGQQRTPLGMEYMEEDDEPDMIIRWWLMNDELDIWWMMNPRTFSPAKWTTCIASQLPAPRNNSSRFSSSTKCSKQPTPTRYHRSLLGRTHYHASIPSVLAVTAAVVAMMCVTSSSTTTTRERALSPITIAIWLSLAEPVMPSTTRLGVLLDLAGW